METHAGCRGRNALRGGRRNALRGGAGSGFRIAFRPLTPGPKYGGIGSVREGTFQDGQWVPGRWLNRDETDPGNGWRLSSRQISVEKRTVYRYE